MKTFFKSFILALAVVLPARATTYTDTFTTNDSSNYHELLAYYGSSSPTLPTFAVNGSGEFQPTGGTAETTLWLENTGWALSDTILNQSVSLTLDNVSTSGGGDAIGFSNTLTPTNATVSGAWSSQAFDFGILYAGGRYAIDSTNTSIANNVDVLGVNFSLGSITETITRTADNEFSYSFTGPGLTSSTNASGTFTVDGLIATGQALYFGPDVYGGPSGGTGQQIEDNLTFVPEPSTYALLAAGAGFLVLLVRRKPSRV